MYHDSLQRKTIKGKVPLSYQNLFFYPKCGFFVVKIPPRIAIKAGVIENANTLSIHIAVFDVAGISQDQTDHMNPSSSW